MLLNAAKSQDYSFCRFSVIKENSTGGGGRGANYELKARPSPLTPRLGLKRESNTGAFL